MLSEVLVLVNRGLTALGHPPLEALPQGLPVDECRCVIAEAFSTIADQVDGRSLQAINDRDAELLAKVWGTEATGEDVVLPLTIREFVEEFDRGVYPELINYELKRDDFVTLGNSTYGYRWDHNELTFRSKRFATRQGAQADLNQFFQRAGI